MLRPGARAGKCIHVDETIRLEIVTVIRTTNRILSGIRFAPPAKLRRERVRCFGCGVAAQLLGIRLSILKVGGAPQTKATANVLGFMTYQFGLLNFGGYCLEAFDTDGVERAVGVMAVREMRSRKAGQSGPLSLPREV